MKTIVWDNPDKMHFESPHKTFNRQTQCISAGNVIGNTQRSSYVRPYHEIECNGFVNPPGHLQNYDLTKNIVGDLLPSHTREEIRELTRDHGGIAYHFHHWQGEKRIRDGIVLTEGHDRGNKLIKIWYLGSSQKSRGAVDEAVKYITN